MSTLNHQQRVRLLYKSILRLHRSLPKPMKELGDSYAKEEFRRHKKANEAHTALFMKEWTKYYVTLSNQVGKNTSSNFLGQKMTTETLDNFTDDQLVQLHELYTELKDKS
ncbi:hypothetical protein EB796_008660 [Bugula neritina]|uniref:Succinate dehydrogenase assembly factor 3 n=1 Tax=Bugula neritina TaxID=10212 RepID=A0A7J7K383_BUGNE|nr:hypothetical protein EB796_008660 [Bugula neritina]